MIGKTLGHFRILEKLGSGGMAEVYVAEDATLNRNVALKILPEEMASNVERRSRFEREAKAVAALNHPNIVTVFSVEQAEGLHFIAMELVVGKTLYETIYSPGVMPVEALLRIAVQVAEGLAEAHARGIIHRDLKPQNVMVTDEGRVKILDFGLAKALHPSQAHLITSEAETISAGLRREGKVVGTVAYMSPEQALGKDVDSRSDVFSFGTMLYEMTGGRRPFEADTVTSVIAKILEAEPAPLPELRPDVPVDLIRIVGRCLQKNPDERYNDTRDLAVDLRDLLRGVTSGTVSHAGAMAAPPGGRVSGEQVFPPLKRRTKMIIAGTLVGFGLLAFVVAVSFVDWRPFGPVAPPPAHKQITFTGDASYPALSPDGNFIAYVTGPLGQSQKVWVHDVVGGQALEVYKGSYLESLRWSPDGAQLLFAASSENQTNTCVVPRLGGPSRQLPYYPLLSWSPDGSRFAGSYVDSRSIELIDILGGEPTPVPLTGSFRWLHDLDWSPRGDLLLSLTTDDQERTAIWTVPIDGGQQHKVVEDTSRLSSPRWSPSGKAVYYFRAREQITELWKAPIDPTTGKASESPVVVLSGLQAGVYFTLSGDGKKLLHTRESSYSNLWAASFDDSRNTQEPKTRQLTTGTLYYRRPSLSPKGDLIAFSRGDDRKSNIFVMPLEGDRHEQLTFFDSRNGSPAWSPAGHEIAFASNEGGTTKVWKVNARGGTPSPYDWTELSSNTLTVVWSPGEKALYQTPGNRNFAFLDPTQERFLVADESVGWVFDPRYSPDGAKVAVWWNRFLYRGLWIISLRESPYNGRLILGEPRFASIGQRIEAGEYTGKEIRLNAQVKTKVPETSAGQLWLRVDRENQQRGFLDNMNDRPVRSREWREYQINGKVDDDAENINFGCILNGQGQVWVDGFQLSVLNDKEEWELIEIGNAGFEEVGRDNPMASWRAMAGRERSSKELATGYRFGPYLYKTTTEGPYEGKRCLLMETVPELVDERSFRPIGWSSDGTQVYVFEEETGHVVTIPATGGPAVTVFESPFNPDQRIGSATMTPDGKRFVFAVYERQSDVWLIENFDPDVR